jgi:cytochrome c
MRGLMPWRSAALAALLILVLTAWAERPGGGEGPAPGGDARRGAKLIAHLGCGGCHSIPGIADATGLVGPPLDNIGDRAIIAGVLANTPDNMITWLKAPHSVVPGNAMPNMELNDHDASDVAAYLYSLR